MDANAYDLVVIGSGPAGQKAAIAAAKLGRKVAVIDRKEMIGGVCLNTGTIPSKTLREAILYLSGIRMRTFYGRDYTVKDEIAVEDLAMRVQTVVARETEVIRAQLKRNRIAVVPGTAKFVDPHTLEVDNHEGALLMRADHILIACGTRPAHNPQVPLDGRRIIDSDQLINAKALPRELIVVGAGVIGLEYASMLAALDIEVTIIEARPTILDFVDREIVETLHYFMRQRGATFRLGEKVTKVERDEARKKVIAHLESGKRVMADALLYSVGRQTNSDLLNLPAAGLTADERGRLKVNDYFQTEVPHIYAAGDVIGFPALASTSMEQGRLASCHMFGNYCESRREVQPYGIYTIPEISMVGKNEQELTEAKVPYEVGVSKFEELAKGQMIGADVGLLKILFDPDSKKLLGVHAIGDGATEIIHIGQAVLAFGGTIEYFRDTVFNYPTLAEAYKVAGLDGLNKL
ncbi:MAG TPA: Si-specific NAD(P)(+) transhydrogenase [Thermoanaerobaculia bacterium]